MRSIFNMIAYTNSPNVYDIMRLYSSRVRIPPYVATIADIIMVTPVYSNLVYTKEQQRNRKATLPRRVKKTVQRKTGLDRRENEGRAIQRQ